MTTDGSKLLCGWITWVRGVSGGATTANLLKLCSDPASYSAHLCCLLLLFCNKNCSHYCASIKNQTTAVNSWMNFKYRGRKAVKKWRYLYALQYKLHVKAICEHLQGKAGRQCHFETPLHPEKCEVHP